MRIAVPWEQLARMKAVEEEENLRVARVRVVEKECVSSLDSEAWRYNQVDGWGVEA